MSNTQAEREMLEAAAKAMDLQHEGYEEFYVGDYYDERNGDSGLVVRGNIWNPLTDDGDCARMEAALGIYLEWHKSQVLAFASSSDSVCAESYEGHNGDKQAARRMASLRVAAEIGRSMK